jgi:sensor c-di-GMP phosphodiesterase-like protein
MLLQGREDNCIKLYAFNMKIPSLLKKIFAPFFSSKAEKTLTKVRNFDSEASQEHATKQCSPNHMSRKKTVSQKRKPTKVRQAREE